MTERTDSGGDGLRVIAADLPLDTSQSPIEPLLSAFRKLASQRDDVRLLLTGKRCPDEIFSVYNELDRHALTERARFLPYYNRCDRFPVKKPDCDVWLSRHTPGSVIDAGYLQRRLESGDVDRPKYAMFFTSFHPGKQEGNSTLMRRWLEHLKSAGYIVHVVYYMYDIGAVNADMRRKALYEYDLYKEVAVVSKLTGANYNGLNVHVDDWCGSEAMDAVTELCNRFEYDIAITNYPWMSAVFDRVHDYTRKVLLTHDSFVNRNRRMLEQGYPESGWMSISQDGERIACERSDVVVAMQEHEAEGFRALVDPERVRVIGPIFEPVEITHPQPGTKLRIGYFGSSNWVNEQNLGAYLKCWAKDEELRERSEILIGGGVCETLKDFVPASLLANVAPQMIGRVDQPADFFARCDLIINPERGGTGIKIKTLEAMAHGCAVLTTTGGSVGLDSDCPYHMGQDFATLARLSADFIDASDRVEALRRVSAEIYGSYVDRQRGAMNDLLGPPLVDLADEPNADHLDDSIPDHEPVGGEVPKRAMRVPAYVRQTAADYHFEEFERLLERVDVRGKRVLEIGSDYHLASARLFMANGADSVVATNIGDWRSDEPLPDRIEFRVCDASDADLPEQSFDIIYGIAIIEHVPDFERLCNALKRFLKKDGVIYFQGCPMWAGTLGHHVWYSPDSDEDFETVFAKGGGKKSKPMQYSFTDNNPIPDWAHLAMTPDELERFLIDEKGLPPTHARGIVEYVHNLDGTMVGSCSNFFSASEVLAVMRDSFEVESEPIWSDCKPNAYFEKAREKYSEEDLRTLGLRVWMTHKGVELKPAERLRRSARVSLVIPFYKVEAFIEDCIKSVLSQDHDDLEIIFVDDASPDGSRAIVERYMKLDERITLVTHAQNQGLGPARNTGVAHASGEYLLFLDSDDYFSSKRAISTLVQEAQASGCPVVVGSCDRVMSNGERLGFDREYDRTQNGQPGSVVSGEAAYLGASFIPGGQYVPMRAWGTLIDRFVYLDSGLEYPPAEHEDLPHTPFLYHFAGRVLYIPDIVVTYRDRSDSISNTGWDSGKIRRQGMIWRSIKENVERFGLQHQLGNTAVKTAEHLVMKLRQNGIRQGAESAAFDVLEEILRDAQGDLDHGLLFYMLDSLRGILDFKKYDYTLYSKLTGSIPTQSMVEYYRHRIGAPPLHMGHVPVSAEPDVDPRVEPASKPAQQIEVHTHNVKQTLNERRVEDLLRRFRDDAPDTLRSFPSMLTEGDFALYFDAGRNFEFRGSIVDAGCFVGGTTMSLVQGLLQNPLLDANRDALGGLIRVYDLFEIDDDYILGHLKKNYPQRDFDGQRSFLGVFEDNLAEHLDLLDIRPGDVMLSGYRDNLPIEILGVDLCKALPVTDYVVRTFFPHLLENALVIQQDFVHQYHPHIHLSMMLLDDCFELDHELRWGGSLSYRLKKPITPSLIAERFGDDLSWYSQTDRNTGLLRELEQRMFFEENRWVLLQVMGIYLQNMGQHDRAHALYHEAIERFPHFQIPDAVERLIGTEAVRS